MIAAWAFDAILVATVLAVAGWTIAAREAFAAVVGFVAYGLLLALVWVRLAAPDVALTETAIGGGVTGVLLLGAAARLRGVAAAADEWPAATLRLVAGMLCATVAAALAAVVLLLPDPAATLAAVVLLLPDPAATLAPQAAANLPATGLGNAVNGVLMAYRALDTLLEKVVLVLALIGVWSLAADRAWGGIPGPWQPARRDDALVFLARLLPPAGIVIGVYLVWAGADEPGGAFQGGALLAAMWILAMMAGLVAVPSIASRRLRLAVVGGPALFLAIGLAGFVFADAFLAYPVGLGQAADHPHRGGPRSLDRRDAGPAGGGAAGTGAAAMSELFGLAGAALVGLGLYGLIVHPEPLRKILAFNLLGSGVFLLFGVIARRAAAAGLGADPIPQALVITGIVVAFAGSALAVALLLRLHQRTGRADLRADAPPAVGGDGSS
jgi:multisubunit Na+/H+ antiporter MnhC subunit/multisubunit Na+/H+ antiporter MnhB subunit